MSERTTFDDRPLPELLRTSAARYTDRPAVIFSDRVLDYATLDRLSDKVAAFLAAQSLRKGERVGLYCANCDAFVIAYFGILKAGCTVVPINVLLNPKEVAYVLEDAGARALFYHGQFQQAVVAACQSSNTVSLRVCMAGAPAHETDVAWEQVMQCNAEPPAPAYDINEDVAVIIYTSGTTGKPKGAMLTHRNLAANAWSTHQAFALNAGEDAVLVVLPLFHAFAGTVGMLLPLFNGCAMVIVPRFEPQLVADAIAAHRATLFLGVPSMYSVLLRLPDAAKDKLQSLHCCVAGGAAMPLEVMKQFEAKFGKLIYEGDGPTECSPVTSVNPLGGVRKPGSIGLPIPLVEMKIMDGNGHELPDGENGEICVRGPNVMKGYWQRPEESAASFFGEWFRTGDVGHRDADGYFYIVDRIKDLIIVNGMNVYPRVIEEVLYQFAPVSEAAVVGEPDKLHGEIPVAYIVLKDGSSASEAEVRAFCREHLGRHEVPRRVHFLPELPKTPTGKILKRALSRQGEVERGVDVR